MKREDLAALVNPLFDTYGRMTVRQVYYQLVSGSHIGNSVSSYKAFDALLTRCREDGLVQGAVDEWIDREQVDKVQELEAKENDTLAEWMDKLRGVAGA